MNNNTSNLLGSRGNSIAPLLRFLSTTLQGEMSLKCIGQAFSFEFAYFGKEVDIWL